MRLLLTLLISILLTTLAAMNGAWQLDHENNWSYTYNPVNELCMGIASAPGYMLMLEPSKEGDDRPPEAWPLVWKIAPISGVFWGIILGAVSFSSVKLAEAFLSWQHNRKNRAEQVGTGQPATRSESRSEGSDKPQPESEGRSR